MKKNFTCENCGNNFNKNMSDFKEEKTFISCDNCKMITLFKIIYLDLEKDIYQELQENK